MSLCGVSWVAILLLDNLQEPQLASCSLRRIHLNHGGRI